MGWTNTAPPMPEAPRGYILSFEQTNSESASGTRPFRPGEYESLIEEFQKASIDKSRKIGRFSLEDGKQIPQTIFNIGNRKLAVHLARRENQPYIWDIKRNIPIKVNGTGQWVDDPRSATWPSPPTDTAERRRTKPTPQGSPAYLTQEFWQAQKSDNPQQIVDYLRGLSKVDAVRLQNYLRGIIVPWIIDIRNGKLPSDAGPYGATAYLAALARGTTKLGIAKTLAEMSEQQAREAIFFLAESAHVHHWRYIVLPGRIEYMTKELVEARNQVVEGKLDEKTERKWAADDWRNEIFYRPKGMVGVDARFNCCRTDGHGFRSLGLFALNDPNTK